MRQVNQFLIGVFFIAFNYCAQADFSSTNLNTPIAPSERISKSDIVAMVNGHEITKADLNSATSRSLQGVTNLNVITRIKTIALSDLINERLASEAFEERQTSQIPQTVRQLERLKRQVVMNFYLSGNVAEMPKPDPRKIESYLRSHPEFVEDRETFHFSQILIDATKSVTLDQVQAFVNQDPALNTLVPWLQDNKIPSTRQNFWRGTDQLTPTTLEALRRLKKGDISVEQSQDQTGIAVLKLLDVYSDPVILAEARVNVNAVAEEQMRNYIAKQLLMKLRSRADIQIFDEILARDERAYISPIDKIFHDPSAYLSTKFLVAWVFSLLILVPVVVIAFYRQFMRVAIGFEVSPERRESIEFLDYLRITKLLRGSSLIVLLPMILYWLYRPLLNLLIYPPIEIEYQTFSILAISGLLFGSLAVLACLKLPQLYSRMKSGWIGMLTLMGIELMLFCFGIG